MQDSICHFIPYRKEYDSIHTINFVLENKEQKFEKLRVESVYKAYYVTEGEGNIHTFGRVTKLKKGDVFFTFPASPFCIESEAGFEYMYISYLGTRANMIMDKLRIASDNFYFKDCSEVEPFWRECIKFGSELSDMASESVLLYTFSYLGKKTLISETGEEKREHTVSVIKKYVDDNFCDSDISLRKISKETNYSEKYVSATFKACLKIGITDYINTLRVQYACTLIKQGHRSVKDISNMCGYNDANYFSKLFKKRMGVSPREYLSI